MKNALINYIKNPKNDELYTPYFAIDLLVLDKRINFMPNKKTCWFNTSWFCYGFLPKQLIFEEVS